MKATRKKSVPAAILAALLCMLPACREPSIPPSDPSTSAITLPEAPAPDDSDCTADIHTFGAASCLLPATCTLCGETAGDALGHSMIPESPVLPTCTLSGSQRLTCARCNTTETVELAATGHIHGPGFCLTCGAPVENAIKNVILIIGDGMGQEHITAGERVYGENFAFTEWIQVSSATNSLDENGYATALTDSAASGTALATGVLTENGRVGVDRDGNELETILDFAKDLGKSTGVLSTAPLYDATPATFSAHAVSRDDTYHLVMSQIRSGVDFLAGTTDTHCTTYARNIQKRGYTYVTDMESAYAHIEDDMLYCQLDLEGRFHGEDAVKLADAAVMAIDFLDKDEDGFVLMIEQAHIDDYSHFNEFDGVVNMVKSLDETVDAVMAWVGDRTDTVVIITADHETGGLCVTNQASILANSYPCNNGDTVYYSFQSTDHTETDVGLYLYGAAFDFSTLPFFGSSHVIKNSDVPSIIRQLLTHK